MKRIVLFLLTNMAILLVLLLSTRLLGVDQFLAGSGLNLGSLLVFAAVIGFGGSFISLWMSKWMAKRSTGAQVIEQPRNSAEVWLLATVRAQAEKAGIAMPEVAIFQAPNANAFATGPSRNNALVAVSTGLLEQMDRDEVEAVLAHEVSHVANGDMVTMTLIQGVVNTFVVFIARVVGFAVDRALAGNRDRGPGVGYYVASMVAELVFGLVASIIVMWFSRQREFRADAGGASLSSRAKMISALQRLQQLHEPTPLPGGMAAFGIQGAGGGWRRLFMTHPPLEERIEALRRAQP